jgi:HAD superfamily hydrolase (TIGR01456 family)
MMHRKTSLIRGCYYYYYCSITNYSTTTTAAASVNKVNKVNKTKTKTNLGICFDIDGVLLRGPKALHGAHDSLKLLNHYKIPYTLLTNGGGVMESKKAKSLSKILDIHVPTNRVILSHTPMKSFAISEWKDKPVLVLGCKDILHVSRSYGLQLAISPEMMLHRFPAMYDNWNIKLPKLTKESQTVLESWSTTHNEPIECIMIMTDPIHWHLELGLCLDIIKHRFDSWATTKKSNQQQKIVTIYNANDDLEFSGTFPYPRIAQGSFLSCLHHLNETLSPPIGQWKEIKFGKPHSVAFDYAKQVMNNPTQCWMIGDNPTSDIRGANSNPGWISCLVKSGTLTTSTTTTATATATNNNNITPSSDIPKFEFDSVWHAVEHIVKNVLGLKVNIQ